MKRIFLYLGIMVGLAACYRTETKLNNDPKYSQYVGKEYRTRVDLVLAKEGKKFALHVPGTYGTPELKDLKQKFPYHVPGLDVHGVIPKGSIFRLKDVIRHRTIDVDNVNLFAEIVTPAQFRGTVVFVSLLTDVQPLPKFDTKYVEETTRNSRR